jgi:hypothetical protein
MNDKTPRKRYTDRRPSKMTEAPVGEKQRALRTLERQALAEGYKALESDGPEAAVSVLRRYVPAINQLRAS